ncbi:MAG: C_GCAxxG_C_C family protein [Spirochaetales bacterium]|nr:C_GCAxxG_C_C family protein [Spirochaetales bacterium]
MTREELMTALFDSGFSFERDCHGCAQATVKALTDYFPIDELVFKVASPCSGGIVNGGTGPCGGFLGGALVIGYFFGRDLRNQNKSGRTFADRRLVASLRERYRTHYGSEICREVQRAVFGHPFDLYEQEDIERFEREGGHTTVCPKVVGTAVRWVAELLLEEGIDPRNEFRLT